MIKKQFYGHLVDIEILHQELDSLDLTDAEKDELKHHIHHTIHYTVLDVVMSDMEEEHKKTFLEHIIREDHEAIWQHLRDTGKDVEQKIQSTAKELISGFIDDIKKVRKN